MNLSVFKGGFVAFLTLCIITMPLTAKADTQTIKSADNAVWGSFGTSFLNYKESVTPIPDSEHGWLSDPSLAAGATFLTDSGLYFAFDGSYTYGHTNYNGAYFFFPNRPLQGTTRDTIGTIDGKIGRSFILNKLMTLTPYMNIGFRHWDRDFGQGQNEHYENMDALGGLLFQVSPVNRLILSAYAAAGTTFGAQMQPDGSNTYDLGDSGIYKLGGKVGFDVTKRVEVFTTLDFDQFHYVQSSVASDGTYEPTSRTSDTTMRIGAAYHFR